MAKDLTDLSTVDLLPAEMDVVCGQVLMDRHRHIAIVVKTGRKCAYLVKVSSGMLRLTKYSAKEIVEDWQDTAYPFSEALARLMFMGRRHGMTDGARGALEELEKSGKEPTQAGLF